MDTWKRARLVVSILVMLATLGSLVALNLALRQTPFSPFSLSPLDANVDFVYAPGQDPFERLWSEVDFQGWLHKGNPELRKPKESRGR